MYISPNSYAYVDSDVVDRGMTQVPEQMYPSYYFPTYTDEPMPVPLYPSVEFPNTDCPIDLNKLEEEKYQIPEIECHETESNMPKDNRIPPFINPSFTEKATEKLNDITRKAKEIASNVSQQVNKENIDAVIGEVQQIARKATNHLNDFHHDITRKVHIMFNF